MKKAKQRASVVVFLLILSFIATFELIYRSKVENSREASFVKRELYNNKDVAKRVGTIRKIELIRLWTSFYWNSNGGKNGRFNLRVTGTEHEMNVFITWHSTNGEGIVIDKIDLK